MSDESTFKASGQKGAAQTRWAWLLGGASVSFALLCPFVLLAALAASMLLNGFMVWQVAKIQVLAVSLATPPPPAVLAAPTAGPTPAPIIWLTPAPVSTPTPTPSPTIAPPTPTPHPLAEYTIAGLEKRDYAGGTIKIRSALTATEVFTRYYIEYPSDGLTITGIMQVPPGNGPFPVIVLNHGYIPRDEYRPGADTAAAAGYLNRAGYLTIAPDFRSWGGSDTGNSFFSTGQLIDMLNLISSLPSLAKADIERVGIWGHSMGGGVALKAITIDRRIKAAVLYAPVSANDAEILARWGPGCGPSQPYKLAELCGGAEVVADGIDAELFLAYANAIYNPDFLRQVSPIHYLEGVTSPVQIHIGAADTRTPPEWSADIYEALLAQGKPVEYYTYPEQGHAFKGESWYRFMKRVADFYDRQLKTVAQGS